MRSDTKITRRKKNAVRDQFIFCSRKLIIKAPRALPNIFMEITLPAYPTENIGLSTYAVTIVGAILPIIKPMPAKKARPRLEKTKFAFALTAT